MNRRDLFRGVGAAAASLALDQVPVGLEPAWRWVSYLDEPPLLARLASVIYMSKKLRELAEADRRNLMAWPAGEPPHELFARLPAPRMETES